MQAVTNAQCGKNISDKLELYDPTKRAMVFGARGSLKHAPLAGADLSAWQGEKYDEFADCLG